MDVQNEHQSFTSFRSRGRPEQGQRYRRYSLGRRGYANKASLGQLATKGLFMKMEKAGLRLNLGLSIAKYQGLEE